MGIGRRIKQRREELGMTQEELAKRLGYKSKSTVNKVELEINDITQSKINAYANALDTTVISLMGYEEDDSILSKETLLTIGNKISHQRKLLNISADDLSKQLGISRATLYRYENGDVKKIPSTILNPLATILQTTPADLMGWNDIDTLKPEISTLGEKIKQLRSNMNISQVDFATKIGVSKQTLYKYENNIITNIPFDKIEDIARIANVSPAYLMGWEQSHTPLKESFRERLSNALADRKMKPIELSEITGIPKSAISQYMSGYTKPKQDRISLISKALNVSEVWLLGYDAPLSTEIIEDTEQKDNSDHLLSKNIRYLRLQKGFSQSDIADKLGYKSFTTIQKWESGISEPPIKNLTELAVIFGVSIEDLITNDFSNTTTTLGKIIKEFRTANNLSIEQFADLSDLSKGYISMLENNVNPRNDKPIDPTFSTLKKIASAMNYDLSELIYTLDSENVHSNTPDEIREIIKSHRLKLHLTLEDIARKVGVSAATISRWESGDIANMKRDKIVNLANALHIPANRITGYEIYSPDACPENINSTELLKLNADNINKVNTYIHKLLELQEIEYL